MVIDAHCRRREDNQELNLFLCILFDATYYPNWVIANIHNYITIELERLGAIGFYILRAVAPA